MLVLKRNVNERIRIGDDIEVVLVGASVGKARIGVDAPASIKVHRQEIYDKIQRGGEPRPVRDTSTIIERLYDFRRAGAKFLYEPACAHVDAISLDALLEYIGAMEARAR